MAADPIEAPDEAQLQARREALALTDVDRQRLRAARARVESHWPDFLDELYARLHEQPEMATLLRVPGTLERLKGLQLRYLQKLFTSAHDTAHAKELVRMGLAHYRIHITPQLYIATYSIFITQHARLLLSGDQGDTGGMDLLLVLVRSIFYDMCLVLDAYGAGEIRDMQSRRTEFLADSARASQGEPETTDVLTAQASWPTPRVRLTGDDVAARKALIGLAAPDIAALRSFEPRMAALLPGMMEDFYAFVDAHPETAGMIEGEALGRLKHQVASYWRELAESDFGRPYASSRVRIGVVHEAIGLSLQWYLSGLMRQLVELLAPRGGPACTPDEAQALVKAVFFDLTFVIDAYMEARADALTRASGYANDLVAGLPSAVAVLDRGLRVLSANPAFVQLLPGGASLLYRMPIQLALPMAEVESVIRRISTGGDSRAVAVGRLGARSLKIAALRLAGRPGIPEGGMALVLDDITDLLRLSEDATSNDAKLAQLMNSVQAVLWELDCETLAVVSVSAHVLALTGHRDIHFLGRPHRWLDVVAPRDRAAVLRRLQRLSPGTSAALEYRIVHVDATERWVRTQVTRVVKPGLSDCWQGVTTDISDQKRLESIQWQAVRMMAGGIAHVINNALMSISGRVQLYMRQSGARGRSPLLAPILDDVGSASEVTSQLLAFSGQQALLPGRTLVTEAILDVAVAVREEHGQEIRVECLFADDTWPVIVDSAELISALWALVDNALEAIEGPGDLVFSTRNIGLGESTEAPMGGEGEWVEVAVSDSGSGMPQELRNQAITPFVSTKSSAESHHGLGLSMVYGFVSQSGGYLQIDSTPGKGTTVRLRFPRCVEASHAALQAGDHPTTVLVVEDYKGVRDVTLRMLESAGYSTLSAASAADAQVMLGERAVDILLADVRLGPGPDGVELSRLAQRRKPGLAVVLMSGYTAEHFNLASLPASWLFLQKPFTNESLLGAIEEALLRVSSPLRRG